MSGPDPRERTPDSTSDRSAPVPRAERGSGSEGGGLPAGLLAAAVIALLGVLGIGTRYLVHGDLSAAYVLLSVFFSTNLTICYWEVCLFIRRDQIEQRAGHWRDWQRRTGRSPAVEFLASRVPLRRAFSPTVWADAWATYSQFDGSFADRRTYGFNIDIANGFFTPVPSLFLYAAFTIEFLPAMVAGILGVMLFWQWTYGTSLYWVSFFVAGRQHHITKGQLCTFIGAMNAPWVLCALAGLYVSVRLILEGGYGALGY